MTRALIFFVLGVLSWAVTQARDRATEVVLFLSNPPEQNETELVDALRRELREIDLAGGAKVEFAWVTSDAAEAARSIRSSLDRARPRVVVTTSISLARAVQRVDGRVPIVFRGAADPVAFCLVDSLRHPGRNATGETRKIPAEVKMLEALSDAYPDIDHVVTLVGGGELAFPSCTADTIYEGRRQCRPGAELADGDIQRLVPVTAMRALAASRRIRLEFREVCTAREFGDVGRAVSARTAGLLIPHHFVFEEGAAALVPLLDRLRVRAVYGHRLFLDHGGVIALAATSEANAMRSLAEQIALILRGRPPGELPVEVPRGFEIVVSLKGIGDPSLRPSLLLLQRADRMNR